MKNMLGYKIEIDACPEAFILLLFFANRSMNK